MSTRDEQFQQWLNGEEAKRIATKNYDQELGGARTMIEDLVRSAFDAGFEACLVNVRARLSDLGKGGQKPRTAASTKAAGASRPRKGL